jgi:hypothetical protein
MIWNKENIIGKKICVGIIYLDDKGAITDRLQNYGIIVAANDETIEYKISGTNEVFVVPAYYDNLETADKEIVYILENTGEQISEIDIVATYTVVPEKE